MPWKAWALAPAALGSSRAVVINSSRLIDSMLQGGAMWAQPSRRIFTTAAWSATGSNLVLTACGAVMTSLSASAVAKILTRIGSIGRGSWLARRGPTLNGEYSDPILTKGLFLERCWSELVHH